MSRTRTQRAILSSEFFWYGGHLGPRKVHDSGTSFNAAPVLRDSGEAKDAGADDHPGDGERFVHYVTTDTGWKITFDPA
jgi:hypothetical protein